MAISKGARNNVPLSDILDYLTEEQILNMYVDTNRIPCTIQNPSRDDNNASLSITYSDKGKLRFHDFGNNFSGGLFDFLMEVFQSTFKDAVIRVYEDMRKKELPVKIVRENIQETIKQITSVITKIDVKVRKFRDYDLKFWSSFGISQEWCRFGDIYPISHIFILKDGVTITLPAEKYAYAFIEFKDGNPTFKIYQPYSENYKWLNKHDKSVWDLWTKLPQTGHTLIITSSRKDALCIWATIGIPATSLQAESLDPKSNVIQQLKDRFDRVYILYDNDFKNATNVGRINGAKLAKLFDLIQIEIPEIYKSKDPSDLYKNHGKEEFLKILNELIDKNDNR